MGRRYDRPMQHRHPDERQDVSLRTLRCLALGPDIRQDDDVSRPAPTAIVTADAAFALTLLTAKTLRPPSLFHRERERRRWRLG